MENNSNNYTIPISIIIAGAMIAGAVMFSSDNNASDAGNTAVNKEQRKQTETKTDISMENLNPVNSKDHIIGNPNATIKIVEYSDFECPFCKKFHATMQRVMDEYGKKGEVAWVYRQFPIKQLHPKNAFKVATAAECAAEQGGNDGFWSFTDRFFELTPSNDRTDLDTVIPQIVNEIDLDSSSFEECLASGRYDDHIQSDMTNAIETGARGTPWSIIVTPSGKKFPIDGAQQYQTVKSLIDIALKESN